jgi:hypothetical protein
MLNNPQLTLTFMPLTLTPPSPSRPIGKSLIGEVPVTLKNSDKNSRHVDKNMSESFYYHMTHSETILLI